MAATCFYDLADAEAEISLKQAKEILLEEGWKERWYISNEDKDLPSSMTGLFPNVVLVRTCDMKVLVADNTTFVGDEAGEDILDAIDEMEDCEE